MHTEAGEVDEVNQVLGGKHVAFQFEYFEYPTFKKDFIVPEVFLAYVGALKERGINLIEGLRRAVRKPIPHEVRRCGYSSDGPFVLTAPIEETWHLSDWMTEEQMGAHIEERVASFLGSYPKADPDLLRLQEREFLMQDRRTVNPPGTIYDAGFPGVRYIPFQQYGPLFTILPPGTYFEIRGDEFFIKHQMSDSGRNIPHICLSHNLDVRPKEAELRIRLYGEAMDSVIVYGPGYGFVRQLAAKIRDGSALIGDAAVGIAIGEFMGKVRELGIPSSADMHKHPAVQSALEVVAQRFVYN